MKIKNKLKEIRNIKGFNQKQPARMLNISVRQYRSLESKTPKSVIQFYNLAKLYNTTIDDLLEQDVENKELFKLPSKNSSSKK